MMGAGAKRALGLYRSCAPRQCEDAILLNRPQVWVNLRSSPPPVPDSLDLRHLTRTLEIPTLLI